MSHPQHFAQEKPPIAGSTSSVRIPSPWCPPTLTSVVTISSDLRWNLQVNNVCSKATRTLNFVKRNIYGCSREAKSPGLHVIGSSTLGVCVRGLGPAHQAKTYCSWRRYSAVPRVLQRTTIVVLPRPLSFWLIWVGMSWPLAGETSIYSCPCGRTTSRMCPSSAGSGESGRCCNPSSGMQSVHGLPWTEQKAGVSPASGQLIPTQISQKLSGRR